MFMSTLNRDDIMTRKENGFSMMEMIIVIGIIAILATLITPLAVNYISQKRYEVCNEELKIIKQAIIGDPTLIEGGTRSSFGFVGDLGRLPQVLEHLTTQNLLPTYANLPLWQKVSDVWFGWRGPYISELKDPWGALYEYSVANVTWPDGSITGWPNGGLDNPNFEGLAPIVATIWSHGQDGINGNADDVSITIRADEAFSMISGNTVDECGANAAFSDIRVSYPALTSMIDSEPPREDTTIAQPHFNIETAIPIGIRYITVVTPFQEKLIYINNGPLTIVNLRAPGNCPSNE